MKAIVLFLVLLMGTVSISNAQLLQNLERKLKDKVERKTDEIIDKSLNNAEKSLEKKPSETKSKTVTPKGSDQIENSSVPENEVAVSDKPAEGFSRYNKFDFIPGENILAIDDFSQDDLGQAPLKWNYNGNAEIVKLKNEKWAALSGLYDTFYLDFINKIPENFTLEFNMAVDKEYKGNGLKLYILNRQKMYDDPFKFYASEMDGYLELSFSPTSSYRTNIGDFDYHYKYENNEVHNRNDKVSAFSLDNNSNVRVSIWRQNQRIRVYINETKVWDLPRAFAPKMVYNALMFHTTTQESPVYVSDIRLAEGKPDNRTKFVQEGRFSTTGIYFDSNSAKIKPQSYAVLKEVAKVFTDAEDSKILIVGHTDGDGSADLNLKLSKDRANAVKDILVTEFGLSEARFETEGKGKSEPVGDNSTPEGKSQNRRVEFIKK